MLSLVVDFYFLSTAIYFSKQLEFLTQLLLCVSNHVPAVQIGEMTK
jgi:hypothetical protein